MDGLEDALVWAVSVLLSLWAWSVVRRAFGGVDGDRGR